MNDLITIRLTAKNDAKPVLHDFNNQLKQTQKTAKDTGVAAQVMGGKFTGMGRNAGQAGIQIQQLVGQIQGGTNPMLALSQQAADLGFVLGAPLVGAVAGLAASFAMVLLPSLFEAGDSIEDVIDLMDDMVDKTSELSAAQRALKEQVATDAIEEYRDKIQELQEDLIAIERNSIWEDLQEKDIRRITEIKAAIDTYQQKIAELTGNILHLKNGTDDQSEADAKRVENLQALIKSTQEQAETLGMTSTQLAIYKAMQLGASDADIERLQTLGMTIEAYEAQLEKEKEIAKWKEQYDRDRKKANEDMLREQEQATRAMEQNLRPVEDALVDLISGTKSVKEAFKDMARSIVSDLIRMQIQRSITAPLAGMLAGFNPFGTSAPVAQTYATPNYMPPTFGKSNALGGQVSAGQAYTVGEHGRETFIPATNGTIVPDSGAGVTINQTIQVTTGVQQTVRAEIQNLLPQITQATKQAVADSRQRGGGFSKALVGA